MPSSSPHLIQGELKSPGNSHRELGRVTGLAAVGRKKREKEDGTAVPIASKGDRGGFIAEVPL